MFAKIEFVKRVLFMLGCPNSSAHQCPTTSVNKIFLCRVVVVEQHSRKTHMRKLLLTALISIASLSVMGEALAKGPVAGGSQGGRESVANSTKSTDRDFGKDRAADRAQIKDKNKTSSSANGGKSLSKAEGKARADARHHRVHHASARK